MIHVLEHNYGRGRVTRPQIRAAIKAVRVAKAASEVAGAKPICKGKTTKKVKSANGK